LVPVVEEELSFRASGYVGTIYVERDEMVEAGELLAELETTDLKAQVGQARANLETIQLQMEQDLAQAQANLRIAELRLAQITASDPHPEVLIAEIDVQRAQMALTDAQEEADRLVDDEASPRPGEQPEAAQTGAARLRAAELDLKEAEARYQAAYQTHYYGVRILEQQLALARLRLQAIEAGTEAQTAELAVKRLEDQLAAARIEAPFRRERRRPAV
jgi:multidrug efflux pump subunit AcrA (membrane-fusion protein)